MPWAAPRKCIIASCRNLTQQGARCLVHRGERERARGTRSERGYGGAWPRLRAMVLRDETSCRACGADGQSSDHVDHIIPTKRGGTNERDNLQRLCARCHSAKTVREDGGFGR